MTPHLGTMDASGSAYRGQTAGVVNIKVGETVRSTAL